MVFRCINIRQVPWEVLKTAASGFGFQHLSRDLANVNAWKTMFDPYNDKSSQARYETNDSQTKNRGIAKEELRWTGQ